MASGRARKKTANLLHEHQYYNYGYHLIVGLDEAGRGAWAGPVVAGAVCLPVENRDLSRIMHGVNDSKQLTARQRSDLADKIRATALAWGVGSASHEEIDANGIVHATMQAMQRALGEATNRTHFKPDVLFIDAMLLPDIHRIPQVSLIGGDSRSLSIAAASILAKVWRDAHMVACAETYPDYHFAENKGYGGGEASPHQRALKLYGPCAIHRKTFAPVQAAINKDTEGDS